jgi:hypothetical protein
MFLPRKHKAKNPTIIYYVYIMDHETISYKTLIQDLSIQYTIVSYCDAKIGQMHVSIYCLQITRLLYAIPANGKPANEFEFLFLRLRIPYGHIHYVCGCMSALTNVTIDSQTIPFTCYLNWVSTGSDMHVVNNGKSSVACGISDCELINN